MLVAETRLWLSASDPKLTVAFATCAALAGAGAWNNKYPLILLIPLVVIFLALILVYQLDNIIRLGAQLTVVEERINALLAKQSTLTYHSRTVIIIFDQPYYRDPISKRKRWSLNIIYNGLAIVILLAGSGFAIWYGWPKLSAEDEMIAYAYATLVIGGTLTCVWLLLRAMTSKSWYLNVIRSNLAAVPEPLGGRSPREQAEPIESGPQQTSASAPNSADRADGNRKRRGSRRSSA